MVGEEAPQLYLVSPPEFDFSSFPNALAAVLDTRPVACFRLALATQDAERLARAAEACRVATEPREVALVVAEHVGLAERLGLDGVHLAGPRGVRAARKALGADAIVGASCGTSRHDGLNAGEAGADYVSFGPVRATGLGDGAVAERDLFEWWSEVIEVPVVAEGGMDAEMIRSLWTVTDFIALGEEIWGAEDPVARLAALIPG